MIMAASVRIGRIARACTPIVAAFAVVSCSMLESDEPICVGESRTNIAVEVRDSATGAAAASGATGQVAAAGYQRVLIVFDSVRMEEHSPVPHAGKFSVSIARPGYHAWSASDVVVAVGGTRSCPAAITTVVQARLQRDGSDVGD